MRFPNRQDVVLWAELRRRMIDETNERLTEYARRPERAVRIPVVEAGRGKFPPSLTPAFWDRVLYDD